MSELNESFRRLREHGFAGRFYERFLDADPSIRPLFVSTDFARQRELFEHGVHMMLEHRHGRALGTLAVRRLGRFHDSPRMRVPDRLYPLWIASFLDVAAATDPEWSAELAVEWHRVLSASIAEMIASRG